MQLREWFRLYADKLIDNTLKKSGLESRRRLALCT